MRTDGRIEATKFIWGASGLALIALFISGGMANGLTGVHLVLGIVLPAMSMLASGFVWSWGVLDMQHGIELKNRSTGEKVKRDRIEKVLKDLSSEELVVLKQRLSSSAMDDDMLQNYLVEDDSEWVNHR